MCVAVYIFKLCIRVNDFFSYTKEYTFLYAQINIYTGFNSLFVLSRIYDIWYGRVIIW